MRNVSFFFFDDFLLLPEVFRAEALTAVCPDIALFALSVYFFLELSFLLLSTKKLRLSYGEEAEKALRLCILIYAYSFRTSNGEFGIPGNFVPRPPEIPIRSQ